MACHSELPSRAAHRFTLLRNNVAQGTFSSGLVKNVILYPEYNDVITERCFYYLLHTPHEDDGQTINGEKSLTPTTDALVLSSITAQTSLSLIAGSSPNKNWHKHPSIASSSRRHPGDLSRKYPRAYIYACKFCELEGSTYVSLFPEYYMTLTTTSTCYQVIHKSFVFLISLLTRNQLYTCCLLEVNARAAPVLSVCVISSDYFSCFFIIPRCQKAYTLKIWTWNFRGLAASIPYLRALCTQYEVVCITEH